jgi:hypothetical protein
VFTAPEGASAEDVFLDPNSQLGVFLRCCILAFNSMTFEVLRVVKGIHDVFSSCVGPFFLI